ncbi:hypothetical protein HHL22_07805 [Hymenobacter sp. RP-2-7]|uniref:Uncharacterized protein n=1 Tax=Hymenobacter polaris TaxID=2682546 RepID=A0A7Y0AD33_9BACT|nr:hypothetical protein [Hymenobacter polaris]NML65109.1 hypothetical protein [Hymenobacter polaris]
MELLLTFTNKTSSTQEFTFSNQSRKAELLGLQVVNQAGQRVLPTHNLLIKPAQSNSNSQFLAAGDTFSYLLKGIVTEYGLEFPGALFELQLGEPYQLQFYYAGQKSNQTILTI